MSDSRSPQDNAKIVDPMTIGEPIHVDRYEAFWIRISLVTLVAFGLAIIISSSVFSIQVPGVYQRINPNTLMTPQSSLFANPGLRELAPGQYEAYIRSQIWAFTPSQIRIPAGANITFYVTSQDVQHGFKIAKTNINMMVLPGQISKLTTRFDEPGTYNIICHEYCGIGHHNMYGQIIVE
ncbi:MAG: cytochrome c oxidase subunit II [Chloroflexota bacterium]